MHLDEVARRSQHADRELFSMVLQRFLCHKSKQNIGFLITSLLSTPAESKIFEKEQKFLKLHAHENEKVEKTAFQPTHASSNQCIGEDQFSTMMHFMQMMNSAAFRHPPPPSRVNNFMPRRGGFGGPRPRMSAYTGCYKCGELSHLRVDCPNK